MEAVNRRTGKNQGEGEGHGWFHTNFDISNNANPSHLNDLGQVGGKARTSSIQIATRMQLIEIS